MAISKHEAAEKLLALGDQINRTYFKLSAVVDGIYASDLKAARGVSPSAMRSILRDAAAHPIRTVPDIASHRSVSRQYVQKVINALAAEGMVDFKNNPKHRRSKLITLTVKGQAFLNELAEREFPILIDGVKSTQAGIGEIDSAVGLLERLSEYLDGLLATAPSDQQD